MKQVRLGIYRTLRSVGLSRKEITPRANFSNDLFFDQYDWTCFLYYLERHFNVSIPDSDVSKLSTIGQTIDYIEHKILRSNRVLN